MPAPNCASGRLGPAASGVHPLARKVPHNVYQAKKFLNARNGCCAVPVRLLVDTGHALYLSLFGSNVKKIDWLSELCESI